jgi:hypothetical protein
MNTEKSGKSTATEVPFHTLLTREIRPERNWHELMERWQAAVTKGDMEGVLHRGFSVSFEKGHYEEREYDHIDRLIFYFIIADGWNDHYQLYLPTDKKERYFVGWDPNGNSVNKTQSELRQQLARKAFDVLCLNFFKEVKLLGGGKYGNDFNYEWQKTIISGKLFPFIRHFFRAKKEHFGDRIIICNLSRQNDKRSHNEEHAVNFLLNLTEFIFGWEETEITSWSNNKDVIKKHNCKMRSILDASKPWMIEILTNLDRLDVLQKKWVLKFDKACLAKLKEIALHSSFSQHQDPVREDRPASTIDEACYLGSKAAWLLKKHELIIREHKRFEAISKEKRKKAEADSKIKNLTAKR